MPEKLSYEEFLESLRLSPRLAVELVVKNEEEKILLLKRDREPYKDFWHLPGGFLLKGELISDCFRRLSRDELGSELNASDGKFEGLFENIDGDPRGHILHYVISIKTGNVGSGEYFSRLPDETIPYQRDFLNKLGYK